LSQEACSAVWGRPVFSEYPRRHSSEDAGQIHRNERQREGSQHVWAMDTRDIGVVAIPEADVALDFHEQVRLELVAQCAIGLRDPAVGKQLPDELLDIGLRCTLEIVGDVGEQSLAFSRTRLLLHLAE
jgi:hypothetical protein